MQDDTLAYWIWIVMVMGFANKDTFSLIQKYPDVRELYSLMLRPDCRFLSERQKKHALQNPLAKAEAILETCRKKEIQLLTCQDACYPDCLRHIYSQPALLFYKGNPAILKHDRLLTVVGTRHPSEYSIRTAKQLCHELVCNGLTLVSGGALGLDTVAHQSAVEEHRPTVSVLGCGIDYNYPKGIQPLKEKIIQNGLLLSEYFPGTPPYGRNFPVRNRILSGISPAVLVTEASRESGCMITANLACDQGKDVFCIPPADIYDKRYSGQIFLLHDGAALVCCAEDILNAGSLAVSAPEILPEIPASPEVPKTPEIPEISEIPESEQEADSLSETERHLLQVLEDSEKNINMLCCMTGLKFETISMHLLELELLGWVVATGRDFYTVSDKYRKHSSAL
ncbi:MAG: DNA-processing protein DprA [Oscillospiraceae bacterium]|nr:DNA-processing protein DprA [Oscillospiraceae bacterium]